LSLPVVAVCAGHGSIVAVKHEQEGDMEPIFTLANHSDVDLLVELMQEFYTVEHLPFHLRVARQGLQQILSNSLFGLVHLISSDGVVIGYIVLTFGFSLEFHGRDAMVDELYLREFHRGKGIGKACLQFVEEICRREGIKALHLEVERVNTRAQAVYRQAGYLDHDRYLLTKWLEGK
jgi:GNAT superfamily N-acetyltransferase